MFSTINISKLLTYKSLLSAQLLINRAVARKILVGQLFKKEKWAKFYKYVQSFDLLSN
jgi:hypothetical protein